MPWIVGIDEAGYGPRLGPLVMSLAAVRLPDGATRADPWKLLAGAVCRGGECRRKLLVDDSKLVYQAPDGLPRLERHFLPFQWHLEAQQLSLETFWRNCCFTPLEELEGEPWYASGMTLPLCSAFAELATSRQRLLQACNKRQITIALVRSIVLFPRQFNALLAQYGSKGAAPAWALGQLLSHLPLAEEGSPTRVMIDKLGGRNHYHELLQRTFPDSMVMTHDESARESRYKVFGLRGHCEICLQPRADATFFPVALASMASKYLREVLMAQFNGFWQAHVPGLRPTAGYYGDADRFYADIRPAREKFGIADEVLWRAR